MNINNFGFTFLRIIKNLVVKKGFYNYKIRLGLFRGLKLKLNLSSKFQVYLGLYEQETHKYIRKSLNSDTFIDVGASGGELCALFANNETKIIAIEPIQEELDLIKYQIEMNSSQKSQYQVIGKFCGNNDNFIKLDDLDIAKANNVFIKIDVECAELGVLKSANNLLNQKSCSLLVETHSLQLERDCMRYLTELGYACKIIKNAWWRLFIPEVRPLEHCRWIYAEKLPKN